ncbi:MAG: hypothetical protein PHQ65_00435 [Bacteroidales bacterium]|nr:hypothetical protein [Bacteroidales bacterium]MDD3663708.1 hypothetical protein [Bacteroidales bacterium]
MKSQVSLGLLLFITGISFSQEILWKNPAPIGESYNVLQFANSLHGVAAGQNGALIYTFDGGHTWSVSTGNDKSSVVDLDIVNDSVVFACTQRKILQSTDGGISWETVHSNDTSGFLKISFSSSQIGYALCDTADGYYDRVIASTTDGGRNWELLEHEELKENRLNDIEVADDSSAVVVSNDAIFTSHDGLRRFSKYGYDCLGGMDVVKYAGNGLWYAAGGRNMCKPFDTGVILSSTDNGDTWNEISQPSTTHYFCLDAKGDVIVASGMSGFGDGHPEVVVSVDGGQNWQIRQVPEHSGLIVNGIALLNDTTIQLTNANNILRSSDLGATWQPYKGTYFGDLLTGVMVDSQTAYFAGRKYSGQFIASDEYDGVLNLTRDGGQSWEQQQPIAYPIVDLATRGASELLLLYSKSNGDAGLLYSGDHASTWNDLNISVPGNAFKLFWPEQQTVFLSNKVYDLSVSQLRTTLFRSSDMGQSFVQVLFPENALINNFVAVTGLHLFASGTIGGIGGFFSTHDGGESWQFNELPGSSSSNAIFAPSDSLVFVSAKVSGIEGIWRYSFESTDWHRVFSGGDSIQSVINLWFSSSLEGKVLANDSIFNQRLFSTTDGGNTWKEVLNSYGIQGFCFQSADSGYLFGLDGRLIQVLPDQNTAIVDRRMLVAEDVKMSVSPYPAGKQVVIRFENPLPAPIHLSFSDLAGRKLTEVKASSCEASSGIVMNTSHFSSGFYILTVRSSSFKHAVKVFINN